MKKILIFFSLLIILNAQSMTLQRTQSRLSFLLGEMPLEDHDYFQYYGTFSLGTPAQNNITFILDTSSSEMWVTTTGLYNSSASSTANITHRNGTITYGGSQVKGYLGTEMLGQSHLFLQNVKVGLLFETALINISSLYTQGIIGLDNNKHYKNFIELAVEQGYLKNSIFGFEVSNIYGSSDFFASSLSFPSRLSLTYYNCSRSEYWTIRIKSTVIAENTYSQEYNAQEALISSASSALMIGASAFVGLQNQLSGLCQQQKDFYLCDCTDKTLFPSIYFNTELETTLQVVPNAYLIPRGSGEFCTLGVTVSEYPFMIFGDAFMKNYFIAFDKENNKIGISIPQKP